MKIQRLTEENRPKVDMLLSRTFEESKYESALIKKLHESGREMHEWVSIQSNKIIAYIAFTHAYEGRSICGLHLALLAVNPEFQNQGVGSELLRFALRQEAIKSTPVFVLGDPAFFQKFGFAPCAQPLSPFAKNNAHFLSLRHESTDSFTIGYDPEFRTAGTPPTLKKKKNW